MAEFPEADEQNQAETLDETHLTEDGEDLANFDEIDDVIDVTSAVGDAGEDDGDEDGSADWSEGEADDAPPEDDAAPLTRLEDRPDNEQTVAPPSQRDEGVADDADSRPAGFEAGGR